MLCRSCDKTLEKTEPAYPVCTACRDVAKLGAEALRILKGQGEPWGPAIERENALVLRQQLTDCAYELGLLGDGPKGVQHRG